MAFKSFAALAALALLAVVPAVDQATALSVGHSNAQAVSRAEHHNVLARRSTQKRCAPRGLKSSTSTSSKAKATTTKTKTTQKPTSTAKASQKSASPPPPPKVGSSKIGMIGTNTNCLEAIQKDAGGKIFGGYNYNPSDNGIAAAGIPFVPMLANSAQSWDPKTVQGPIVLSYNEVNQGSQALTSPEDFVQIWNNQFAPVAKRGIPVALPSTSNGGSAPIWYREFQEACTSCYKSAKYMNLHIYSNNRTYAQTYLQSMYDEFKKPVIVSECGCANWSGNGGVSDGCSDSEVVTFARELTQWMDAQDWIHAYFWFGDFDPPSPAGGVPAGNALFNEDCSLTPTGQAYLYH